MPSDSGSPPHRTFASLGEDALIDAIRRQLQDSRAAPNVAIPPGVDVEVPVAMGDDAAVVKPTAGGPALALTTDMLVESVHFLPDHPPQALGAKAATANLSDLAAMGAWPAWILVALGAPGDTPLEWVESVYRGIADALNPWGCLCLGGDCVRAEARTLSIAAGGYLEPKVDPVTRSRARPGQNVYVTGCLGDSAAGLELLQAGKHRPPKPEQADAARELVARHHAPTARVAAGAAIARHCPDAAMMDLSDGLATDLPRLARASGCGLDIRVDTLPMSRALRAAAPLLEHAALDYALAGGEDYELLFTTARPETEWLNAVARAGDDQPIPITRIGRVTRASAVRFLDERDRTVEPRQLFKHF